MDHKTLQIPCPHFCCPHVEPGVAYAIEEANQTFTLGGNSRVREQLGAVQRHRMADAPLCATTKASKKPKAPEKNEAWL